MIFRLGGGVGEVASEVYGPEENCFQLDSTKHCRCCLHHMLDIPSAVNTR